MSLTISPVAGAASTYGNHKKRTYKVTFDASYPDDGESLVADDLGLRHVHDVIVHGVFRNSDASDAIGVSYDYTNEKLVAYWQLDPADTGGANVAFPQVDDTTDLSAYSGHITVFGY